MEQDPWCEIILSNMANETEATIRDAFVQCFNDDRDNTRSMIDNRRMAKALILSGWKRAGKFTSGDQRNQVKFINPSPSEKRPEVDYKF